MLKYFAIVNSIMLIDWGEFLDYHLHNNAKNYVLSRFRDGELRLEFYNVVGKHPPSAFLDVLNDLEQEGKISCKATPFNKNPKQGEPNQVLVYKLNAA